MFINRYLVSFARGHGGKVFLACLMQFLLTAASSLIIFGIAVVVRMLMAGGKMFFFTGVWQVFLIIAALIVFHYFFARRKTLAAEKCSLAIKASVRETLLKKLLTLGPRYTARERTGAIASAVFSKVEFLNEYYTIYLPQAAASLTNAALILIVLFAIDAFTASLCLAGCIGMTVCPMIFYFVMRERGKKEMAAHAQYYSDCLDSVQGMPTLKAFNASGRQKKVIHEKGEQLREAVMSQMRVTMIENVVLQFFSGLGSAFAIAVAAWQCARGALTPESLVFVLFLIRACFSPMTALINAWHMGYRGVVASYSLVALKNEPVPFALPLPGENEAPAAASSESIVFDNVSFAYNEKDGPVLKNVSFTMKPNTTTALVGASGSGKSTVAHILAGFYPVLEGEVRVGNRVLNQSTVGEVQSMVSAVWQDCHLFYGTAEDNIRLGKPNATMEEITRAAKAAGIHDFISGLPEGYQTMLGERGMRFSGGERQRVALARAFLRDAPVIILDEATSSLDRKNEQDIQNSFGLLSRGKTALVIAHRLNTIQNADRIIILKSGRVHTEGSHEELLKTSDEYRKLMGGQLAGPREGGKSA